MQFPAMLKATVNIAGPALPFLPAREVSRRRIRRVAWRSTAMKPTQKVGCPT